MRRLCVALTVAALAAGPAAGASTTVRVGPGAMGAWTISEGSCANHVGTGQAGFVNGPAAPPIGPGSARLVTGPDGDSHVSLVHQSGPADLSALSALAYSTYVVASTDVQAPYLTLRVDHDADGQADGSLLFEPAYQTPASGNPALPDQGAVARGVWQTWDAFAGGWWATDTPGFTPGAGVGSLADYLVARPGARIVQGGLRVSAGCGAPSWNSFDGSVDAVTVSLGALDATYDFEPDALPPDTSIIAGPSGTVHTADARFEFTSTEPGSFRCALDGGPEVTCSTPFDLSSVADGLHVFSVRAVDQAGNADPTPATRAWTIDTPPPPTIGTPAHGAVLPLAAVRVSGSSVPGATVMVFEGAALLGEAPVDASGRWVFDRSYSNGVHTVFARARDGENIGPPSGGRTFTVDTVPPPAPLISSPAADALVGPQVVVEGTTEASSSVHVYEGAQVIGTVTSDGQGRFSMGVTMSDGRHEVRARAIDRAGNVGALSAVRAFDVDARPPAVQVSSQSPTMLFPGEKIVGTATDGYGVRRVEVVYTDVIRGVTAGYEVAACTGCGVRTDSVAWQASVALPPGYYLAAIVATDLLDNRSQAAYVSLLRL